MTLFAIPGPVRTLFDHFPLETYPPIPKRDDAMAHEFSVRTYDFQGANSLQDDVNNTFTLGVYNVFRDSKSDVILATDPWCLYAQLSLCKKNLLKLSQKTRAEDGRSHKPRHRMALLSPMATQNETLPILIEGYNKRFIRSSESIHETLRIRVGEDPQQLMYITLLDHIIYDCWITQVLFHITNEEFLKLYSFEAVNQKKLVNTLVVSGMKAALIQRNEFYLRHKVLARTIDSTLAYQTVSLPQLLDPILEKCKKVLQQFQTLLIERPTFAIPTYLELKLASYVLCAINLSPMAPLRVFLEHNCQDLVSHSSGVLEKLSN